MMHVFPLYLFSPNYLMGLSSKRLVQYKKKTRK